MIKVESFLNNALILFLILLSGSVFQVAFFSPTYLLGMLFVLFSLFYKITYSLRELKIFAISLTVFFFLMLSNYLFSASVLFEDYRIFLMKIFLSLLIILSFKVRKIDVKLHLYIVLRGLLILSLVGLFLSVFHLGKRMDINESGYTAYTIFYVFYYFADINIAGMELYRNQGVFWEPGLLAVYSNVFFLLSFFIYKNKKNSILAVFCILTTLSTTGILLLLIQLLYYMREMKLGFIKRIFIYLAGILLLFFFAFSFSEKKSEGDEKAKSSFALRSFDLYSGAMVAFSNPVFGVGLNKDAFIKERNKFLPPEMEQIFDSIENRGNSNSLINLFSSLGMILGLYFLYLYYKQDVFPNNKTMFFIISIICFASEPILFAPFGLFFILIGFHNTIKIKL